MTLETRLDFLKQYTIENDRQYKLGLINKFEWLEERTKIFAKLIEIEREMKK